MAYPADGTAPVVEMLIGGVWTDVSSSSRVQQTNAVTITRGLSNGQTTAGPQQAAFTFNDRDGKMSNSNPLSAYYGLIPLFTQTRVRAGTGDNYVRMPWNDAEDNTSVTTADKATLDVVGDIDVRIDILPRFWRTPSALTLAGKWNIGTNQRSWAFWLAKSGQLGFEWTTDGTLSTLKTAGSTIVIPATSGRLSVRVSLDVDNGAGQYAVQFFTAATMGGSYTQLGSTVTGSTGTTSIFSGSANLVVGGVDDFGSIFTGGQSYGGKLYAFQMRNSAGTVVANPDFSTWGLDDTSKVDTAGTPNTWALRNALTCVSSDRVRFWGELSSIAHTADETGNYVSAGVTASGQLQRLTKDGNSLRSPMYRDFSAFSGINGFWPFEDGSSATNLQSGVTGGLAATFTGCTLGDPAGLPGASGSLNFTAQTSFTVGQCLFTASTGTLSFMLWVKMTNTAPVSAAEFLTFSTTGSIRRVSIGMSGSAWNINLYTPDGVGVYSHAVTFGTESPVNQWVGINLLMVNDGSGNCNVSWRQHGVAADFFSGIGPTLVSGAVVGRAAAWKLYANASAQYAGMSMAHLEFTTGDINFVSAGVQLSGNAYLGETAGARLRRLAGEQGTSLWMEGIAAATPAMGYQTAQPLLPSLSEAAEADGGLLHETRFANVLQYDTRQFSEAALDATLSYAASHLSTMPVHTDDDQILVNDYTATRIGGGSARVQITDGTRNVNAPPVGVSDQPGSNSFSIATDDYAQQIASWRARVGSWPGARFPNIAVSLHRTELSASASLSAAVMALDIGYTAAITSLPSWLPPDPVSNLLLGYTEMLTRAMWDITFNAQPAGPYRTGVYDYDDEIGYAQYDTAGCYSQVLLNTVVTTWVLVSSTPGDAWTIDPAMYPLDIMIGGERCTFTTAPTGATSPQTIFNVTRSVNGVVKSHVGGASGDQISLYQPTFYSL